MEIDDYHIQILRNLHGRRKYGGSHLHREQALGRLLQEDGKRAKKALDQLIKWGLVLHHPTSYGDQVTLNKNRREEIMKLIEPSD